MKITIDADSCPRVIRDTLYRASERLDIELHFITSQKLDIRQSDLIRLVFISPGIDAVDRYIIKHALEGDFIISSDVDLADKVIQKGAVVITSRGKLYNKSNIGDRLAARALMDQLRGDVRVELKSKSKPFGATQQRNFASQLDKLLTSAMRK